MDEIMTVEEVAQYLKMKPQTIYTWAQKGKIPAAKIGKEWRFRRDVIDAWFNQYFNKEFQPLLDGLKKKKDDNDNQ